VLYQRLEELKDEDVDAIRSVLDVLDALLP
jgi:hypothetical protein